MKKIFSLLTLVLLLSSLLISCGQHPIEEMREKIETEQNCQMDVTMSIAGMTFTMTTQADGDITYTPSVLGSPATYTETKDGKTYVYTQNEDNTWTKEEETLDSAANDMGLDEDALMDLFNPENYDEEDGKYVQKKDVTFPAFSDVTIEIEDDSCTINLKMSMEGMSVNAKIVFSKFGEINLTLPTVN